MSTFYYALSIMLRLRIIFVACFILPILLQTSDAYSMAIDLGSDSMKVAIVMPRKPLEIVLDGESRRKTPTAIAFRDGERFFGGAALNLATRAPELVFQSIPTLLGRTLDHPSVKLYRERFPYHNISYDPAAGQLVLSHSNGMFYTAEELVAMLFEHARDLAEAHAGDGITLRTVVLTTPNFYSQTERRSLIRAAELAGLDVIQLISDNAAVALNFGVSRYASFNTETQHYMFFDVGYSSTTATVVSYQSAKSSSSSESGPVLIILGVGYAPTLGTSNFIYRLRDYMARQFHALHPNVKGDITQDWKAMAKLHREASRVFTMLSANTEIFFQVENVFQGKDFSFKITRNELESVAADAFEHFSQPFMDAVRRSKIEISALREIVLMGGGTRVPKVQSILTELGGGTDLGKGVNNDEAAVLGAVYQAAARTPGFKVLPFIVREYNPYPIGVFFEPAPGSKEDNVATESNSLLVHRVLFVRGNPYPQKRAITFNRHTEDLSFHVSHMDLEGFESDFIPSTNLSKVTTEGVSSALGRNPRAELRGIKAHFTLDHSGLLVLTGIDCVFHPTEDAANATNADQSTLKKLGNKISGLFGSISGSSTEEANTTTEVPIQANDTEHANSNATTNSTAEPTPESPSRDQTTPTPVKKPPPYAERISFHFVHLDSPVPTDDHTSAAKEKLLAHRQADQDRREWESAMNDLEATLFSTRDKLSNDKFLRHSTGDEQSALTKLIETHSVWFDEQGLGTPKQDFVERYEEIRRLLLPIESRVSETEKRPRAFEQLAKELADATTLLTLVKDTVTKMTEINQTSNVTGDGNETSSDSTFFSSLPTPFTDTEQSTLERTIEETKTWMEEQQKKLSDWPPVERPPVLVADIEEKQKAVKREVHYLNKKLVMWRAEMERVLALRAAEQAKKSTPTQPEVQPTPPTPHDEDADDSTSTTTTTESPTSTKPTTPEIKTEL